MMPQLRLLISRPVEGLQIAHDDAEHLVWPVLRNAAARPFSPHDRLERGKMTGAAILLLDVRRARHH